MVLCKVRLFVRARKQGGRIETVSLKRLAKLSGYRKRRWDLRMVGGFLRRLGYQRTRYFCF